MENQRDIDMADTVSIVCAYVSHNAVLPHVLPDLIEKVYRTVSELNEPTVKAPIPEPLVPAVSVKASVKPDHVTCMECGFKGKMLKRHLMTYHGLTPEDYRARWNLSADHPLVAPNYAEVRRELAVKIGLGRKPGGKK